MRGIAVARAFARVREGVDKRVKRWYNRKKFWGKDESFTYLSRNHFLKLIKFGYYITKYFIIPVTKRGAEQ